MKLREGLIVEFLLCCLLFFNASIYSSAQTLEELHEHYQQFPKGNSHYYPARIAALDTLVEMGIYSDPVATLPLLDTLAFLYRAIGREDMYYNVFYRKKGFLYAISENKIKALEAYQNYAQVCTKETIDDAYFLLDVGNLYYDFALYNVANNYYKEAEKIFEKKKSYRGLGTIYSNYSLVAQHLNQLDTALFFIEKTIKLQEVSVKDTLQIAHSYQVLGRFYSKYKKDYAKAIPNYLKSIALFSNKRREGDYYYKQFIIYLPRAYASLGRSYCQLGKITEGLYYLRMGVKTAKKLEQEHAFTAVGTLVGEELILQGYIQEAEPLLLEVEECAVRNSNHTDLETCYRGLRDVYILKKDYDNILVYTKKLEELRHLLKDKQDQLFIINDQLLQQEKNKRIAKQAQIITAEQELKRRLYSILVLIIFILFLALFFTWKLREQKKEIKSYTQKLERSNAIKELLLAVIGHDLRSPFNIIISNVGRLMRKVKNEEYGTLEQAIQEVDLSSRKAYVIMSELMQWCAWQKKELSFGATEAVPLNAFIDDVIRDLDAFVETSCLVFEREIAGIEVLIDVNLFRIILRNLLTNASKNTPFGGTIKLKTRQNEEGVVLRIEDSGAGIPKEQLQQLFDEIDGVQVAQKGSGLGLKLVKGLCTELSIGICAFNSLSSGAVFELQIPWKRIRYLENVPSSKLPKMPEATHGISSQERQELQPYIEELLACEVFELTAITMIIKKIKNQKVSAAVLDWMVQLERIIRMNDAVLYKNFLQNKLGDNDEN